MKLYRVSNVTLQRIRYIIFQPLSAVVSVQRFTVHSFWTFQVQLCSWVVGCSYSLSGTYFPQLVLIAHRVLLNPPVHIRGIQTVVLFYGMFNRCFSVSWDPICRFPAVVQCVLVSSIVQFHFDSCIILNQSLISSVCLIIYRWNGL